MYRVIIVDDEQWIRRWLEKMVPLLREDMEIVASFDNGESAFEYLRLEKVDLIITDIRMPMMTGLELIEKIREYDTNIKSILISGYDEFVYAKKGIELQVLGYLLKPLDKQELKVLLDVASKEFNRLEHERIRPDIIKDAIDKMLTSLIIGDITYDSIKLVALLKVGNIVADEILVGCIQADISLQTRKLGKQLEELIEGKLNCKDYFIISIDSLTYFYFIFTSRRSYWFLEVMSQSLKECKIISGKWLNDVQQLEAEVTQIKKQIVADNSKTIKVITDERAHSDIELLKRELLLAIHSKKEVEMNKKLSELCYYCEEQMTIEECRVQIFTLINELIKIVDEISSPQKDDYISRGYHFCVKISVYTDIGAMIEWIRKYIEEIINLKREEVTGSSSYIIKRACSYMLEHYKEDISATEICERYEISSTYFSKKFKEEVGMNFIEMLTSIRIEAAKRLLLYSERTIREVAENVGFRDAKYFSRVFTINEGCTPKEYREKQLAL